MGNVAVHIEASGLHDNGRDDDIDEMVKKFAADLADAGHHVHRVSVTSGGTRELLNEDDTTPLDAGAKHAWRHQEH